VAGVGAAGLRITPTDPRTTVGHIDLWADPTTGLPLQVEITGRGASTPILVTRFLDISFTGPADTILVPPAGDINTTHANTSGSDIAQVFRSLRFGPLPPSLGGFPRTDNPLNSVGLGSYGTGLTSFLIIPISRGIYGDAFNRVSKAGGAQYVLPDGRAVIVSTELLTVMVMDADAAKRNYLVVGLVSASTLRDAGAELSTFTGPAR
jgi:hypothetical protein